MRTLGVWDLVPVVDCVEGAEGLGSGVEEAVKRLLRACF